MKLFEALKYIFESALDAVAPRRERAMRTANREATDIPLCPTVHDLLGVHITTLMDYQDTAVQDLIRSLKYDGSGHAAHLAAELLADYVREEIAAQKTFSQKKILIVPVPLHKSRARERGFNQIEVVLKALPKEFVHGGPTSVRTDILMRTRETKQQTKLSRSERLSNVAGAFAIAEHADVKKSHIFLIDDVTTTGATLANAATPLRKANAEVSLIALARA